MPVKASVVIATYNCCRLLKACITALFDQTVPHSGYEVIVVDDGSTDFTAASVSGFDYLNLKYIRINRSGRAKARNTGIMLAEGEIVIFVDSDVIPCREFIEAHLEVHESNKKVICRGRMVNIDRPPDGFVKNRPDMPETGRPGGFETLLSKKVPVFQAASFPTCNCSVRREFLIKAGLFDEDFTEYGWEDLELGHRLMSASLKKKNASRAVGFHCIPVLTPDNMHLKLQKELERGRMAALYCKKSPLIRTKLSTMNIKGLKILESLVNMGKWPESRTAGRLADWLYNHRLHTFFRIISRFKLLSYYFKGIQGGELQLSIRKEAETTRHG